MVHILQGSVNGNTYFVHSDIDSAISFNPFTHVYMFDVGFPYKLHLRLARKFNCSSYAKYLISFKPPKRIIRAFGFKVTLVHQMPTSMHGKLKMLIVSINCIFNNNTLWWIDCLKLRLWRETHSVLQTTNILDSSETTDMPYDHSSNTYGRRRVFWGGSMWSLLRKSS